MAAKHQGAAVFVTLTPNENGSATVAYYSGELCSTTLANVSLNEPPRNAKRIEIAGGNPHACELFFSNMIHLFLEEMLGFKLKKKLPFRSGGLFGVVEAFIGGIESQAKKTLHLHLVVYLVVLPRNFHEFDELYESEEFKEMLVRFVDSITCHPTEVNWEVMKCRNCGSQGTIRAHKIPKRAYHSGIYNRCAPTTASCSICAMKYGADDLIRMAVSDMHAPSCV